MEEHILHVKLMNGPGVGDGRGEHHVNCVWLDHQAEVLIIVDIRLQGESAKGPNESCTIPESRQS
jgi:hypothetical protein